MNSPFQNSKSRFSDRVADYVRYRPDYPDSLLQTFSSELGIGSGTTVADIGSGTGISSAFLLELGCDVFGVEPNAEMRAAAEQQLAGNSRFHSVDGSAEATTLPDSSVNHIAAGQAFHWFDPIKTREEFLRVLKPGGYALLFWNSRMTDTTPFLIAYESLLHEFGTDYGQVSERYAKPELLEQFFGGSYESRTYPNEQLFDFDGLCGRLLSSSYAPQAGNAKHEPMLAALRKVFDEHQADGQVCFAYRTELFFAVLR